MKAKSNEDRSRRGSGRKPAPLVTALIAALAALTAGSAMASPEPGSPAPQGTGDCQRVQERLRIHGSGSKTTLCATQTATPPSRQTDGKAPTGDSGTSDSGRVSAQGLRPDSAPRAVAPYCPTEINRLNNAGRFGSCAKSLVTLTHFDSRGRVLGRATYAATYWAQLGPKARSWNYNVKLGSYRGLGTLAGGVSATSFGRCLGGCRIGAAYPSDGTRARLGPGAPLQGRWAMRSPGTRTLSHRFNADIAVYVSGGTNQARAPLNYLATARCDSAAYLQSSGCVYPVNRGVFRLSAAPGSGVTEAAGFYRDAQASLGNHAGRFDGPPLRRTRDSATIRANRRAAQARCGPRPSAAVQCDEYPFASARATTSAFRVRFVPGPQNEEAGRRLNAFYRSSRILDRDPFYVSIVG